MKKLNKKGFTLIELLAVIVILAILVAVAIPAVTRYLTTARKGTFADNAQAAISVVRNDVISQFGAANNRTYFLEKSCVKDGKRVASVTEESDCTSTVGTWTEGINDMLEKKLLKSPYGNAYSGDSHITVTANDDGSYSYTICLVDVAGYGIEQAEADVTDANVKTGVSCTD